MRLIIAAVLLGAPYAATAHSFGRMVTLPMPFWLYAWGAAAALVLGFVVAAVFMRAHPGGGLRQQGVDLVGVALDGESAAHVLLRPRFGAAGEVQGAERPQQHRAHR